MINLLHGKLKFALLVAFWSLAIFLSPLSHLNAFSEAKYKKQTVVDFEGAMVEGKSRKPYSAYLTQQKENAFADLNDWSPDLDHAFWASEQRIESNL